MILSIMKINQNLVIKCSNFYRMKVYLQKTYNIYHNKNIKKFYKKYNKVLFKIKKIGMKKRKLNYNKKQKKLTKKKMINAHFNQKQKKNQKKFFNKYQTLQNWILNSVWKNLKIEKLQNYKNCRKKQKKN